MALGPHFGQPSLDFPFGFLIRSVFAASILRCLNNPAGFFNLLKGKSFIFVPVQPSCFCFSIHPGGPDSAGLASPTADGEAVLGGPGRLRGQPSHRQPGHPPEGKRRHQPVSLHAQQSGGRAQLRHGRPHPVQRQQADPAAAGLSGRLCSLRHDHKHRSRVPILL